MGKAFAQPDAARAARPARPGAADRRRARASERAVDRQHLPASAGAARRGPGHARARGHERPLRLAGDDVLALWLALRDASATRLAEVERAARDYLGEDVEAIDRDELHQAHAPRRRRPRRRPPQRGVRGRPHRRALARSRSTSSTIAWRSCRPTARSSRTAVARSAPTPTTPCAVCRPRGVTHSDSTTAGPNGGSPDSLRRSSRVHERQLRRWHDAGDLTTGTSYAVSDAAARGHAMSPDAVCRRAYLDGLESAVLIFALVPIGRDRWLHPAPSVRSPLAARRR